MEARDLRFEDIAVGDSASFERTITQEDIETFATLSGDHNPLHVDAAYAATTPFKKPLVHGMLVGSLCSTLVGMYLPGKRCLYLEQTLQFKKPVYAGDALTVTGTVTHKSDVTRVLTISISINKSGEETVAGTAKVQVLE